MKKLLPLLLVLLAGFSGWSQTGNPNNLIIYGNVKNISTGNPIKNHRVYAMRTTPGSTYFKETFTDSLGNYRFEVPEGSLTGPNVQYRVKTYDCDSVVKSQDFSNMQGTVDIKNINFEICEPGPQCKALFSYTVSSTYSLRILLNNQSTGLNLTYKWFVNGTPASTLKNPEITFPGPGLYKVCLLVKGGTSNTQSCQNEFCKNIEIKSDGADTCKAYFSFQPSSVVNRFLFTNLSKPAVSSSPIIYRWSFGDGTTLDTKNAEHTFPSAGTYQVCLAIKTGNCEDSICKTVTFGSNQIPCDAGFSFDNFRKAPAEVLFSSKPGQNIANGYKHIWVIGNDTIKDVQNPMYTFKNPGVYNVCHKIFNAAVNCENAVCKTITILPGEGEKCEAYFNIIAISTNPNRFYFKNKSTGVDSSKFEVKWVFGDGTGPATTYNAEHTFTTPGTYTVCLYIRSENCEDHFCKTIVVQGNPDACKADFKWERVNSDNPYKISFHSANPSTTGLKHVWRFSNTNQSELPNPVHTFPGPGTYTICHYVFTPSGTCRDTVCKQIELPPLPNDTVKCKAKFIWFTSESNGLKVNFKNLSTPGAYSWSFGDSTFSAEPNPHHTYQGKGVYTVCLKVQKGNCTDVFCTDVNVASDDTSGFSIGGRIFAGANYADVAKVNLIRRDPVSQSLFVYKTTLADSFGYYKFSDVPSGIYLIRAGLLSASEYFSNYVPTYFGSHYYWQFAEPVVVNADGDTYNISLIYGNNNGGPGGIGGGITGPIRTEGPVNEATVVVTNLSDGPQRWTVTDENGRFSISGLAFGTYRLWADFQGMVCIPVEFTVSEENPQVEFTLNMGSEITIIAESNKAVFSSELYPNPSGDMVYMQLNLNTAAELEAGLFNLAGQQIKRQLIPTGKGKMQIQLSVSDLPEGIYILSIRDAKTRSLVGNRRLTIAR